MLENFDFWILIKIVIICIFTFLALKIINKTFKTHDKRIHMKFLKSFLKVLVGIISIVCILNNFDGFKHFSDTILTSSSLLIVVLGFAFQTSLSDFIAGIFISVFKPFEINDRITLKSSNIAGTIEDITIRHTVIKTFTNSRLIIPNSIMNQEVIENNHIIDTKSSNFMDVQVSYDTDLDLAKNVLRNCIEKHPETINPDGDADCGYTTIFVREFADSGICLRGSVWTKDIDVNFRVCSEIRESIIKEFRKYKIEISYNYVNVIQKQEKENLFFL